MVFQVRKVADIGSSTPWIARLWIGMAKIRDALLDEREHTKFDNRYGPVLDNCFECYDAMNNLTNMITDHLAKVDSQQIFKFQLNGNFTITETIDFQINQLLKDFFIKGNIAIAHLFSLSKFMGCNISFIRKKKDAEFEKAAKKTMARNPTTKPLIDMLRKDRTAWFKYFTGLRDAFEHETLPPLSVQYSGELGKMRAHLPTIDNVHLTDLTSKVWKNLFEFIEDVVVLLFSLRLSPPLKVVVIPEERRDQAMPIKYVLSADLKLPARGGSGVSSSR